MALATNNKKPIQVLYAGKPNLYPEYKASLQKAFQKACLNVALTDDLTFTCIHPSLIDYIIYNPSSALQDFTPFTNNNNNNVKAVFSLRAGVDQEANNPTLSSSSSSFFLTRMVDPGLRQGMVEYVVGHVLRYHLRMDELWEDNQTQTWNPKAPELARQRTVGILGLGELGGSCAQALVKLHFQVYGWSRTQKHQEGVHCRHGADGLDQVLGSSDILVLLLPNTLETQKIINRKALAKCKNGVFLINAGRGSSIDEDALLQALHDGTVAGATLDVFCTEPLPKDHPFWKHPKVLVTPHVAAKTRPETASMVIAENIRRCENGEPLLYLVDRNAGY